MASKDEYEGPRMEPFELAVKVIDARIWDLRALGAKRTSDCRLSMPLQTAEDGGSLGDFRNVLGEVWFAASWPNADLAIS